MYTASGNQCRYGMTSSEGTMYPVRPGDALEATANRPEQDPVHDFLMEHVHVDCQMVSSSASQISQSHTKDDFGEGTNGFKTCKESHSDKTPSLPHDKEENLSLNPSESVNTPSWNSQQNSEQDHVSMLDDAHLWARALLGNTISASQSDRQSRLAIPDRLRAVLIDWLTELSQTLNFHRRTTSVAIDITDTILLKKGDISKSDIQLYGAAALYIASKQEEVYAPSVQEFLEYIRHCATKQQLLQCEQSVIMLMNWNVNPATAYDWLCFFIYQLGTLAFNIRSILDDSKHADQRNATHIHCDIEALQDLYHWSAEILFSVNEEIAQYEKNSSETKALEFESPMNVPLSAKANFPRKHMSCAVFLKAAHILDLVRMDGNFLNFGSPEIARGILLYLLPESLDRVLDQTVESVLKSNAPSIRMEAIKVKEWISALVGKDCPLYLEHPQLKQLASRHIIHHRDLQYLQPHNPQLVEYVKGQQSRTIPEEDSSDNKDVRINLLPSMASVSTISRFIKSKKATEPSGTP